MKPVNTYVMGDMHFGHKRITEFRPEFTSQEEHERYIVAQWEQTVSARDKVWLLGDVAFTREGMEKVNSLPGRKFLIRGNHDCLSEDTYSYVFEEVHGIIKYKRSGRHPVWLSHAPIHPDELRGCKNIHGHVHQNTIKDSITGLPDRRYENMCPEVAGYAPVLLHPMLIKKEPTV
jgi:calcineurin-like phosphoesterase family protein